MSKSPYCWIVGITTSGIIRPERVTQQDAIKLDTAAFDTYAACQTACAQERVTRALTEPIRNNPFALL